VLAVVDVVEELLAVALLDELLVLVPLADAAAGLLLVLLELPQPARATALRITTADRVTILVPGMRMRSFSRVTSPPPPHPRRAARR
jgi:hypothetical protein